MKLEFVQENDAMFDVVFDEDENVEDPGHFAVNCCDYGYFSASLDSPMASEDNSHE